MNKPPTITGFAPCAPVSQAERAHGSEVVRRLRYSDLIDQPESSLRRILEFIGEPFEPSCLEPLRERINSSEVTAEFDPTDSNTDESVREAARQLDRKILELPSRDCSAIQGND
jgi:hypothetical protein